MPGWSRDSSSWPVPVALAPWPPKLRRFAFDLASGGLATGKGIKDVTTSRCLLCGMDSSDPSQPGEAQLALGAYRSAAIVGPAGRARCATSPPRLRRWSAPPASLGPLLCAALVCAAALSGTSSKDRHEEVPQGGGQLELEPNALPAPVTSPRYT